MWSLFDPKEVPELVDLHGEAFAEAYREGRAGGPLRQAGPGPRPLRPDDAHAGRDRQRLDVLQGRRPTAPATRPAAPGNVVHLSNLCTEILEVTDDDHTAVCNLGSINLGRFVADGEAATSTGDAARPRSCARRSGSSTG